MREIQIRDKVLHEYAGAMRMCGRRCGAARVTLQGSLKKMRLRQRRRGKAVTLSDSSPPSLESQQHAYARFVSLRRSCADLSRLNARVFLEQLRACNPATVTACPCGPHAAQEEQKSEQYTSFRQLSRRPQCRAPLRSACILLQCADPTWAAHTCRGLPSRTRTQKERQSAALRHPSPRSRCCRLHSMTRP